jgi:hypothetical protein
MPCCRPLPSDGILAIVTRVLSEQTAASPPCRLCMVISPSFHRDDDAAVLARHALVGAFDLHGTIAKDSVCRRDFTVCARKRGCAERRHSRTPTKSRPFRRIIGL